MRTVCTFLHFIGLCFFVKALINKKIITTIEYQWTFIIIVLQGFSTVVWRYSFALIKISAKIS